MTKALIRARIPFVPVHAGHIEREGKDLALIILPNLAAMSDPQVESVRRFVAPRREPARDGRNQLAERRR